MKNLLAKDLADRFEELAAKFDTIAEAEVSMMTSGVPEDKKNLCNTPACHGGWGFVLLCPDDQYEARVASGANFTTGAQMICEYLGFRHEGSMKQWAVDHPKIWGNKHGNGMFCDGEAFGQVGEHFPVSVIADHYREVAARLRKKPQQIFEA